MFSFGTAFPKKYANDPRALFSVSRSSSLIGIWFTPNHSAKPTITLVLPTPPLPPMERITLFSTRTVVIAGSTPAIVGLFIGRLLRSDFKRLPASGLEFAVDERKLLK